VGIESFGMWVIWVSRDEILGRGGQAKSGLEDDTRSLQPWMGSASPCEYGEGCVMVGDAVDRAVPRVGDE
jgi:hypothetical protein